MLNWCCVIVEYVKEIGFLGPRSTSLLLADQCVWKERRCREDGTQRCKVQIKTHFLVQLLGDDGKNNLICHDCH